MLRQEIDMMLRHIKNQAEILTHNAELFDIFEGDLLPYVLAEIKKQLSPQNFEQIKHRISPINTLKRINDKLSKLYVKPPSRYLKIESEKDSVLFDWYTEMMKPNIYCALSNEYFNLFKNTAIEPYVYNGKPSLRAIPSDRFTVMSVDKENPTRVTHFIKFMGKAESLREQNAMVDVFYAFTDYEFLPFDSNGDVREDILLEYQNPMGINPYGKIPFVYASRSYAYLIPKPDSDTLKMTKLIPVLISDLNFSAMYSAFSIIYGIDIDTKDLTMSPNAFWSFRSDPTSQKEPTLGVLKPEADITEVMQFIMAQLALWLQSKNVRPGAVGTVTVENFASGVSKIVDEMDTYEERQKQVPFFKQLEEDLWNLVMHHMAPVWSMQGLIENPIQFEKAQQVIVEFHEQRPEISRDQVLSHIEQERRLGLITRRDSIMRLNPEMTEDQANLYLLEIDNENSTEELMDGQATESRDQDSESVLSNSEESDSDRDS